MPLTDATVRKAVAKERPYKLYDSGGLFVLVSASSKLWRMRYQLGGKEKLLSFGPYPEVSLAAARAARDAARAALRAGRDPTKRRAVPVVDTFEAIAREWIAQQKPHWTPVHAADVEHSLIDWVCPELGSVPVTEITPPMVLAVLREIEARPAVETARRVRQRMSAVFVFAISTGRATADPALVVRGALAPLKKGKQPALTDLEAARSALRDAEETPAHATSKLALRFLALTAVRPGEVRGMRWTEVDGDLWRIPAERMKMRRDHVVPLVPAALAVLEAVRILSGRGPLVFPSTRWAHRPMSENAMGYLLNRAGYHGRQTPHGWRATFSSIMNERFRADRAVIDLMLAHVSDGVEAAYNRALHMDRRRELAQAWADLLLEGLGDPAALIGMRKR